jgi:hypothetical protein
MWIPAPEKLDGNCRDRLGLLFVEIISSKEFSSVEFLVEMNFCAVFILNCSIMINGSDLIINPYIKIDV